MRIPIQHSLPRDEVKQRFNDKIGDIASFVPGGQASVETQWPEEYRMTFAIGAMGSSLNGQIEIEPAEVILSLDLPPGLAFVENMIADKFREKGAKLLA
ncbi:MAG: polyhydroxyalkanoic acid system family protein [Sphingomonadaceae bacterium]